MAVLDFILQAVTSANHAQALKALLALPEPDDVLVSVAFVREPGLDAVEAAIKPVAHKARFFIGIRNDITSVQAVKRLLKMKVQLYAVDTGSRNVLYHPKLYLAAGASKAIAIIGSANLTFGGLHNNIEVSSRVDLDLSDVADKKFLDTVISAFTEMFKAHPKHVFRIKDNKHADELFEAGRLADETIIRAPSPSSGVKKGERDNLPRMKLKQHTQPQIKPAVAKTIVAAEGGKAALPSQSTSPTASVVRHLVWESKPLIRRDLSIPNPLSRNKKKTNPTGSMLLKKGAFKDIDQRIYFRDQVFAHLIWIKDLPARTAHIERASEKFALVIKNVNCGVFNLELSHNTRIDSAYLVNQSVTSIHWGDAKKEIAKDDLLDRTLSLYRSDAIPPEFTIEID